MEVNKQSIIAATKKRIAAMKAAAKSNNNQEYKDDSSVPPLVAKYEADRQRKIKTYFRNNPPPTSKVIMEHKKQALTYFTLSRSKHIRKAWSSEASSNCNITRRDARQILTTLGITEVKDTKSSIPLVCVICIGPASRYCRECDTDICDDCLSTSRCIGHDNVLSSEKGRPAAPETTDLSYNEGFPIKNIRNEFQNLSNKDAERFCQYVHKAVQLPPLSDITTSILTHTSMNDMSCATLKLLLREIDIERNYLENVDGHRMINFYSVEDLYDAVKDDCNNKNDSLKRQRCWELASVMKRIYEWDTQYYDNGIAQLHRDLQIELVDPPEISEEEEDIIIPVVPKKKKKKKLKKNSEKKINDPPKKLFEYLEKELGDEPPSKKTIRASPIFNRLNNPRGGPKMKEESVEKKIAKIAAEVQSVKDRISSLNFMLSSSFIRMKPCESQNPSIVASKKRVTEQFDTVKSLYKKTIENRDSQMVEISSLQRVRRLVTKLECQAEEFNRHIDICLRQNKSGKLGHSGIPGLTNQVEILFNNDDDVPETEEELPKTTRKKPVKHQVVMMPRPKSSTTTRRKSWLREKSRTIPGTNVLPVKDPSHLFNPASILLQQQQHKEKKKYLERRRISHKADEELSPVKSIQKETETPPPQEPESNNNEDQAAAWAARVAKRFQQQRRKENQCDS